MIRNAFGIRFVCALAAAMAAAVPAAAQSDQPPPSANPFSGLFRGSPKDQPHTLDLTGSAFGAWDDNVLALAPGGGNDPTKISDPRSVKPGFADGYQAGVSYGYRRHGDRSQLSLTANGSVQQFGAAGDSGGRSTLFESYGLGAGLGTNLTNKTTLSFNAAASYAPFYQYAPYLKATGNEDSPVTTDLGYAVAVNSYWVGMLTTGVGFSDRITKKSTIDLSLTAQRQSIAEADNVQDMLAATIRFSHNLTRKLGLFVQYGATQTESTLNGVTTEPLRSHLMNVGLSYGDGLNFTFARYYRLSLDFGASIVKNGDPVSIATTGQSTAFALNGSALLSRSLGRSWSTSIGYVRSTGYIVGSTEPYTTDSVNAGIGGPIAPRLFFSAGAGASRGQQVFGNAGSLVAYTASSKITYGLFKNLGLYAQASYYDYKVPSDFQISVLYPSMRRRSVSFGLSTWLPLIKPRRPRTPDAPTAGQL